MVEAVQPKEETYQGNHEVPGEPFERVARPEHSTSAVVFKEATNMSMEVHKGSSGFYLQTDSRSAKSIFPACWWFEDQSDAEKEALRIAELTGDAILIVRVVSKVIPWHCR